MKQTGSHTKYRKKGQPTLTVIVPIHEKEVRHGTFRSILHQSKLSISDFFPEKNKSSTSD
ncbi:type II toxin-antitoxin system HicA family toxin [Patescibacteria group bacterium]|nr:type II toxin-antitoxin system HicA family toxin [Patescibacteria group bacterium]